MEYRRDEYLALLASGDYDVNAQDEDGKTPLHYAAEQQQVGIISALDAGADPNIAEIHYGHTPLVTAIFWVGETGGAVETCWPKAPTPHRRP